jgi:hypothetical protein
MTMTRQSCGVRPVLAVLAAWVLTGAGARARADFVSLGPTDEGTRTISGSPAATTLVRDPLQFLTISASSQTQTAIDSIAEFNLGAVSSNPRGALVSSATLTLSVAGAQAGAVPGSVSVNGYADGDGLVGLGDFPKVTTLLGNTGNPPNGAPGTLDIPMTFDVTSFIQTLANNKAPFVGFHLEGPTRDSSTTIWGSAAANPAERPNLSITFTVPEPSSVVLTGLGAAGLGAVAWRRGRRAAA